MAAQPPVLLEEIPFQIVNVGAACNVDLKRFFDTSNDVLTFAAQLKNGAPFPAGLIITATGLLSGIPAADTQDVYEVLLEVTNSEDEILITSFQLLIKDRLVIDDPTFLTNLKADVWRALENNMPLPEISALFDRPITNVEIFYLLQRFATLTIWDVYNLEPAGEKVLLTLPEASQHFDIYDRGSCLVGSPKSLFSHERTMADTLQTARVMAREVYRRAGRSSSLASPK